MQFRLITSGSLSPLSGPAVYSARIAAALRDLGHTVATEPGPDGTALIEGAALSAYAGDLTQAAALIYHLEAIDGTRLAAVRHIVTPGEQTAARLTTEFAVPPERITVVQPGIDDLPRSRGSDGPVCRILSVGQVIRRKGHDVLIKALARLFDLEWHLTIAGGANDPVHANGLRALAEDLNVARHVAFAGEATGEAMETLWQSADVFALTPHDAGYGMAFAEALRRGLPVLATNAGAAPALVAPDCGAVCAAGDIDQVSKALRRLIFDKTLRADIGQAAWQAGQALPSWREQAARLAAVLGQAERPILLGGAT